MSNVESFRPPLVHGQIVYSNFDHVLNGDVVDVLRSDPGRYAAHSAWDFHGSVWFDGARWHEEIWRYGVIVERLEGDDPGVLIARANTMFGDR